MHPTKKTKVLLADSHLIFLEGLRCLLDGKFEVGAYAHDGGTMVQLARRLRPALVISEVNLPVMSGIEVAQKFQQEDIPAKIVFLTMSAEMEIVMRAFRAGGSGYVLKQSGRGELLQAIEEVLAGRTYVTPRIARDVVGAAIHSASPFENAGGAPLTKRQAEVLRLVARGKTMKEVASDLGISTRTAEAHKYQMMEHLKVRTVPELIQHGIALGFVEMPQRVAQRVAMPGHF